MGSFFNMWSIGQTGPLRSRDRKFSITSALSIAAHTEGATPNNRVACGVVKVEPGHVSVLFADSLQQCGKWCGARGGCDHGSLIFGGNEP